MTFLAGDVLPARTFNKMGCTLRRAAAQTLNDATLTTVSWDTQDEDTDNLWTSGGTVTIPETGLWAITFSVARAAAVNARSWVDIVPSAGAFSLLTGGVIRFGLQSGEDHVAGCAVIPLAATNTFFVQVFADGAGNSTMTAALTCYRVTGGA